jgi:nucleoside-diphosphate-sugar epimerase
VPRLFCFGLGYTAGRLARRLLARGWQVAGTCRSEEGLAGLAGLGAEGFVFARGRKLDDPEAALAGTTHLLASVPPDPAGDPVLDEHGADLARLAPEWAGYLSTTGVYGDRGGALVDETAELRPSGERGRRRVAAEAGWAALGLPLHVFRLAGIYGPGRSALDAVRAGTAKRIDLPGRLFSRIHVDDLVAVLEASIARPLPGAVYNVCDDLPAAPAEVVAHAARLLGVAPPPLVALEAAGLSPMARSFYDDDRRVANSRIKAELGVQLCYPDYITGLAACVRSQLMPFAHDRRAEKP